MVKYRASDAMNSKTIERKIEMGKGIERHNNLAHITIK